MAKNAVYDYSTTAASNTDIDALDATGATGLVKSGDNYTRSLMSHLKAKANDDGAVNTVGGTGDAITVTLASNPTALVDGMRFSINAPGTNTGAVTIAVTNSGATLLGTKKVRKWSGGAETALSAGDITSGHILNLVYDSARDTAAGAFMIDGSASVAAATTSAAGIVELATLAETLAGSSAALAVTPAGLSPLYSNVLNNAIQIADLQGSRLNMAGGIADAYDSETDVDTATSTNESYDSGNDLYSPTTPSLSYTNVADSSVGSSTNFGGAVTLRVIVASAQVLSTGAGEVRVTIKAGSSGSLTVDKVYIGHAASSGDVYDFESAPTQLLKDGLTAGATLTAAATGQWTGTFTVQSSKNLIISAYCSSGEVSFQTTLTGWTTYTKSADDASTVNATGYSLNGNAAFIVDLIERAASVTTNNMTLVSNAFTASAVPTQARVAVFIDPQVSITINTDFTAEVSRDGGTTWTAVTLALVSNPVGTVEQYEGTVSISAQPSGTSMKYRLKTLNNKDIDVTGIVFQWS